MDDSAQEMEADKMSASRHVQRITPSTRGTYVRDAWRWQRSDSADVSVQSASGGVRSTGNGKQTISHVPQHAQRIDTRRGSQNDDARHRSEEAFAPEERTPPGKPGGREQTDSPNSDDESVIGRGRGRGRGWRADGAKPRKTYPMGHRRLEELYKSDLNERQLALTLISRTSGFGELINSNSIRPDLMQFILALMSKACKSSARQTVIELLNLIAYSPFLERHVAVACLMDIMSEINPVKLELSIQPISHILDLLEAILTTLPSFYNKCQSVLIILERLPVFARLTQDLHLPLQSRMTQLQKLVQTIYHTRAGDNEIHGSGRRRPESNPFENLPPPDDFRKLSICPTYQDIHTEEKPYLRSNKGSGGYEDLSHYLDVQFRLLREDFVSPLREGIMEYLRNVESGNSDSKLNDMRLYRGVQIISPICTNDGTAYRIQFDTTNLREVRWQSSKRLMHGSLLCLSKNNFQTMAFATVVERDTEELEDGFIGVRFVDPAFIPDEDGDQRRYLLGETTAYFEAYRHVLAGLQEVEELPFQRYIVACEHDINPSKYLLRHASPVYDLSSFLKEDATREEKTRAKSVPVLTTSRWPDSGTLCFDDSQLQAAKTALTKEFAIIQGPPGTGKTFVGLKIVQALLENKSNTDLTSPILLVCYTNHALDQFLEGMLDYLDKGLVRIGGRCESERLRKFVIANIKAEMKTNRETRREVQEGTRDCWREMNTYREEIEKTAAELEVCAHEILRDTVLADCMTEEQYRYLQSPAAGGFLARGTAITSWLNLNAAMYGHDEDAFGRSDLFSLKPKHLDVSLAMFGDNQKTATDVTVFHYIEHEKQRLKTDLTALKKGKFEGRLGQSCLWEIPLRDRWTLYRDWLCRLESRSRIELRRIDTDITLVEQKRQKLYQGIKSRTMRMSYQEDSTRELTKEAANLEMAGTKTQNLQETMFHGILLTGVLRDVMTREEAMNFPNQDHLIASWLSYEWIINILLTQTGTENDVQEEMYNEDLMVDAEEEAKTITAQRLICGRDEFDENKGNAKLQERKRKRAEATQQLAVSLERETGRAHSWRTWSGWRTQRPKKRKLRQRVNQIIRGTDEMSKDEAKNIKDVWALGLKDRPRLYRYWISVYRQKLKERIRVVSQRYDDVAERLREVRDDEDYEIMRNATIIGMTTTGAAKYRHVVQRVQTQIVVVEEAAEVLEAHVISALHVNCQHLILIGDHKQLRPSPAVYKLAKDFKLDLSLFERMVNNGIHCDTLTMQHRMRPGIADLIQDIYPELQNHESVLNFEDIRGVSSNIFFLDHTSPEREEEENKSRTNEHEAQFIAALCRYLILQGYKPSQITVLTTYTGQIFALRSQMPKVFFEGVRITAVDSYQGEENDIILLSLVRSNSDGSIGFLKVENRVCVALSRARKGLYVIGNFSLLASKSPMWSKIVTILQSKQQLGPALGLFCQKHPTIARIRVGTAKDFEKAPEGGCLRPCEARLDCGHQCQKPCHILDSDHKKTQCQKPCGKRCPAGHRCVSLCSDTCEPCQVRVEKVISKCQHKQVVPCHQDETSFICQAECKLVLSCGHTCVAKCGEQHTRVCKTLVNKSWPCGHVVNTACCDNPKITLCPITCGVLLECQHTCSGTCGSCRGGKIHAACENKCGRLLVCGHDCLQPCTISCPPCRRQCENRCVHSICGKRCGSPCVRCIEPCEWRCEHRKCTKNCGELCDRERCDEPCKETLPCGHPCIGLCGEVCPQLCRICHRAQVEEIFFGTEDEEDARFILLEDCEDIVEVEGMDQWMSVANEGEEIDVQLKTCPKCKTTIRKSLRYGNVVKAMLNNIDIVKKKLLGEGRKFEATKHRTQLKLIQASDLERTVVDRLQTKISTALTWYQLNVAENQILFLNKLCKLEKNVLSERKLGRIDGETAVDLTTELHTLENWVLGELVDYVSEQQLREGRFEILRLSWQIRVHLYQHILKERYTSVIDRLMPALEKAMSSLTNRRFNVETENDMAQLEEQLKANNVHLEMMDNERMMIVKAIGLPKGHWHKCPNGHFYAIGECGGAMEEGKCPDCQALIGGHSHQRRADNSFAPEMDEARFDAWSDQANMENYFLDEDV